MALGQEDEGYGMVANVGEANATSSCLMVNGLSIDASEREVRLLFNGCAGFVTCVLVPPKWNSGKKTYSFVQFDSQENAVNAGNSRQGTVWHGETQAIVIEMSKKNVQDNVPGQQPQQPKPAPSYSEWSGKGGEAPAKRLKPNYGQVNDGLPKTLYIGGLPGIITQADLEEFLWNNFGADCIGGKLSGGGAATKGGCTARAFVGFISNDSAATSLAALYGFDWDGYTLHADWAKTEFTPGAEGTLMQHQAMAQGKGQGQPQEQQWPVAEAQQWPPADADPYAAALAESGGLVQRNLAKAAAKGQQKGFAPPQQQQSYAPPQQQHKGTGWGPGGHSLNYGKISTPGVNECTLHFANLPPVSDEEFGVFVSMTFPDQVTFSRFVDNQDGRPPVAWVRFIDSFTASAIAGAHSEFEWMGKQVKVQFAKSELDPNIAAKGKGKGK